MKILPGIPVSKGVVIGRAQVFDASSRPMPRRSIPPDRVDEELARFDEARERTIASVQQIYDGARDEMGEDAAKVFLFHLGMLKDPQLVAPVREMIRRDRVSAEFAVSEVFGGWERRFAASSDSVFQTKADDVRDLADRLISELAGESSQDLGDLSGRVVVARDLTPSQAVQIGRSGAGAIVTALGGPTSHTAIVAKALHLPAIVGCAGVTREVQTGDEVIVDADAGRLILAPDEATRGEYARIMARRRTHMLGLDEIARLPAETTDGVEIALHGNIEFPDEVRDVLRVGGSGVGLYRTEFLYLTSPSEPTEEEHYRAYVRCLELLEGRPLTIRTVDLGADKYTQSREEIPERNPFLGLRSIRLSFHRLSDFKTQLRAVLRASREGPLRIMFPLITSIEELRRARLIVHDVAEDLAEEGERIERIPPLGMMVESPSAALMAEQFAREADFFSIGTNDLVQYTLAVDRTNERVAHLYQPTHPAVLRLIHQIVRAGQSHAIPVSVCGESAGDPEYALLLIGLGVRTISATPDSIPALKRAIRSVDIRTCERIADKALTLDSAPEVATYLRDRARKVVPEAFDGPSVE